MKPNLNSNVLVQRLKLRNIASERKLLESHATAREFFKKVGLRPGKIRSDAARLLTSGALAGTLLLSVPPPVPVTPASPTRQTANIKTLVPEIGQWQLTPGQETAISQQLKDNFGITATAVLDGNRLPTDFGRMGAEQHLPRYPGDTAVAHDNYIDKGITPGLGGWGYVTDFNVEKYYVAIPVMYLPDWRDRLPYYIKWYKYRKVVVVNPANGRVEICAVADAGPAAFTGKHFGGSPEVMADLGINYGMQNHPVVMLFLDDPNNEVPLGPLEYNREKLKTVLAYQT